jgi:hypothetical protein
LKGDKHEIDEESLKSSQNDRAYTVLIAESAYLIWRLRCEWRIEKKQDMSCKFSETEIRNRWKAIEGRISLEFAAMNERRNKHKVLDKSLIEGTWDKTHKQRR